MSSLHPWEFWISRTIKLSRSHVCDRESLSWQSDAHGAMEIGTAKEAPRGAWPTKRSAWKDEQGPLEGAGCP